MRLHDSKKDEFHSILIQPIHIHVRTQRCGEKKLHGLLDQMPSYKADF